MCAPNLLGKSDSISVLSSEISDDTSAITLEEEVEEEKEGEVKEGGEGGTHPPNTLHSNIR